MAVCGSVPNCAESEAALRCTQQIAPAFDASEHERRKQWRTLLAFWVHFLAMRLCRNYCSSSRFGVRKIHFGILDSKKMDFARGINRLALSLCVLSSLFIWGSSRREIPAPPQQPRKPVRESEMLKAVDVPEPNLTVTLTLAALPWALYLFAVFIIRGFRKRPPIPNS